MTTQVLLLAGFFVLALVVAWQLVLTLRQARRTAEALERFLEEARPSVLGTAEHLRSLLGRADRLTAAAEEGSRISSNLGRALTVVTGLAAGLQRAWKLVFGRDPGPEETERAAGPAAR